MGIRTHQLLPESAQYLGGTTPPRLGKVNGTAFPVGSLLFQRNAGQYAYFKLPIVGYQGGPITFQVHWFSNGSATTNGVTWAVAIAAVTANVDDVDVPNKTLAAQQSTTTEHLGGQAKRLHASTISITNLDSMAASDQVWLRVGRLNDSYIDDVHLVQIVLSYSAQTGEDVIPQLNYRQVLIGDASNQTEQRQLTFSDIVSANVTLPGLTVAEVTANETPLTVSGLSLTGAGDVPALSVAGTWNTSAAPALVRANVTDTLSSAGAVLLELRRNNVAQFSVGKAGTVASNAITISGYSLTGTDAGSALDISGTWNTSGTPTAIKLNVTDTASNAASLLMDLQTGGTSRFKVRKDGILQFGAPNVYGIYQENGQWDFRYIGVQTGVRLGWNGVIRTGSGGSLTWSNNVSAELGVNDLTLLRDAANILAQRNGTNTQTFRLYNTFTDASNYEALELSHATYSGGVYSRLRAITAGTGADDINLVLSPSGTGAILAQTPDGTAAGGNARGSRAVDLQTIRTYNYQVAGASNSIAIGTYNRIHTNASNGIALGWANEVSQSEAIAMGYGCTASSYSATAIGAFNTASGNRSVSLGGSNIASADYSISTGFYSVANKLGQSTHSAGRFAASGDAQRSFLLARNTTTNATPTELFLDGTSARATVPNDTRWFASVRIVASTATASAAYAVFERRCLIGRGANAAATAIVGNVQTIGSDIGTNSGSPPAGWAVALSADTTNGALKVEVTGAAATTIRWVAEVSLVEVAYA